MTTAWRSVINIINAYLDKLSELDTDESMRLLWEDNGGILGYFSAFHWDLRRPKRARSLAVIVLIIAWLIFGVTIGLKSASDIITYDVSFSVLILTLIMFGLFVLAFLIVNLVRHRAVSVMYRIFERGFIKYDDFPDDTELRIRGQAKTIIRSFKKVFISFYGCAILMPVFVIISNLQRGSDAMPDWFDARLPMPVWFPFSTFNPVGLVAANVYVLLADVIITQGHYGYSSMYLCVTVRHVLELELLLGAARRQEQRALHIFNRQYKNSNLDQTDRFHLYKNQDFLRIYRHCFGKIVQHHKVLLEYFNGFDKYHNLTTFMMVYTSGPMLGFSVYCAIDGERDTMFRLFLVILTVVVFGLMSGFCVIGEKFTSKYNELREELYFIEWYHTDEGFKRSLRIVLTRLERPVTIKSAFIQTQLNHTFIEAMVKMCYSLVGLVQAMK